MTAVIGFLEKELVRIEHYSTSEEHHRDTHMEGGSLTPFGRDLLMIKQALIYALNPIEVAPPFDSAFNVSELPSEKYKNQDLKDCSLENHQEQ